jgi:acetyl esterase
MLDWRASPLRAPDLSGVAPAFVLTASYDPLCDEGEAYAHRLEQEGVRVTRVHFADQIHGFLTMGRVIRASNTAIRIMTAAMADAFSASYSLQLGSRRSRKRSIAGHSIMPYGRRVAG